MPCSARPSSFMRLRISGVTSEKERLSGIIIPPAFEWSRRSPALIAALQVVEEAVDLTDRGPDEFGRVSTGPLRQKPRAAGGEENNAGKQKRRPGDTRHNEADYPGGDQQPAGPSRQLLHPEHRLFGPDGQHVGCAAAAVKRASPRHRAAARSSRPSLPP